MKQKQTAESVTLSTTLRVSYDAAFDFIKDPHNLPIWAINFVKLVKTEGDQIIATTPMGDVPVLIRSDRETGLVDIFLAGVHNPARLVKNGDGCDYLFTLHRRPEIPDSKWETEAIPGLREELDTLKKVLEKEEN